MVYRGLYHGSEVAIKVIQEVRRGGGQGRGGCRVLVSASGRGQQGMVNPDGKPICSITCMRRAGGNPRLCYSIGIPAYACRPPVPPQADVTGAISNSGDDPTGLDDGGKSSVALQNKHLHDAIELVGGRGVEGAVGKEEGKSRGGQGE